MSNRAWVTLATNDSYGLGALVLAHSLRRVGSTYPAVVLITPSVTDAMRDRLRAVFAEVICVNVLDSQDATHLALLQRPELGITFTKIHCWNLTQYERCVFLDADILVVQNCDELFEREELSAAPDVGWPDCFNSGVFVFQPSADTFSRLITFAQERGSFDGGDQGLLNSFFSGWSTDSNKRLPFLYNVTSAAFYSYLPALKHYGQNLKIIHFIGPAKPWLQHYNFESQSVDAPEHLKGFLQLWWDLFTSQVHTQLDVSMAGSEETPHGHINSETPTGLHQDYFEQRLDLDQPTYQPTLDPTSEFPWHHPDKQITEHEANDDQSIDAEEFFDPWDSYRGNIVPYQDNPQTEQKIDHHREIGKHVWENIQPQYHSTEQSTHYNQHTQNHYHTPHHEEHQNWNDDFNHDYHSNHHHYYEPQHEKHQNWNDEFNHATHSHHHHYYEPQHEKHNHQQHHASEHEHFNQTPHESNHSHNEHNAIHHTSHDTFSNQEPPNENYHNEHNHHAPKHPTVVQQFAQPEYPIKNIFKHVYCVHMDFEKPLPRRGISYNGFSNGDDETYEYYDDVRPRHPYDGFYLRHKATIDSRGRKICTHQVPLMPRSPSPEIDNYEDAHEPLENGYYSEEEDDTGVAGNLARVQPGVPAQAEAIDELTRRQGWESGNIDYMGADSFANIWSKISQTLSQGSSSPPKQPSPPKESPPVPEEKPKDAAEELAEKVAVASISEPSDIPVPAIEAANAAGKTSESPVTALEVPEISSASVPQLESKVLEAEENVSSQAPDETVVAAEVSQSHDIPEVPKDSPESTKVEPEIPVTETDAALSSDLHETPVESTKAHEVPTHENDVPKPDSISEKPVDVHAAEPISETPVETQPESVAPETASEVSIVAPKAEPMAPLSDVHDSKPDIASVESALPESKPEVIPSDVHEPAPAAQALIVEPPVVAEVKPAESETMPLEGVEVSSVPPVVSPVETPKPEASPAPSELKQEQSPDKKEVPVSDSPPLANTPSQEEIPSATAAKSEERRRPAGKLELRVPAAADPLPTPDSELEDAAALAQSIIASELRTPQPVPQPPSPQPASAPAAVSLSQIGVKPKTKPSTAAQIESSVTEPKKKTVKKTAKKDGASAGDAPVPPPRKKEKKPKDK